MTVLCALALNIETWKVFFVVQIAAYGIQTLVSDGFMVNFVVENDVLPLNVYLFTITLAVSYSRALAS